DHEREQCVAERRSQQARTRDWQSVVPAGEIRPFDCNHIEYLREDKGEHRIIDPASPADNDAYQRPEQTGDHYPSCEVETEWQVEFAGEKRDAECAHSEESRVTERNLPHVAVHEIV